MIYFLFGPDTYRSREKLNELILKNKKNFLVQKISQENISLDEFKKHLSSDTLFSNKKFLVVEGLLSKTIKNKDELTRFLNELSYPDEDILIFWEGDVDKRLTLFKLLHKKADEPYEFGLLRGEEMEVWIRKKALDLNLNLNHENRKKLTAMLGSDTWLAASELQKLAAYKNGQEVQYEDIDALVRGKLDDDIFKLTDMVAKNEKGQALKLLSDQIEIGSDEIYLMAMIIRQFRILIQLKSALLEGSQKDNYTLAKSLGLHPFVVQKSKGLVRRYSDDDLTRIYKKLLKIDQQMKSSSVSGKVLLEKFILEN